MYATHQPAEAAAHCRYGDLAIEAEIGQRRFRFEGPAEGGVARSVMCRGVLKHHWLGARVAIGGLVAEPTVYGWCQLAPWGEPNDEEQIHFTRVVRAGGGLSELYLRVVIDPAVGSRASVHLDALAGPCSGRRANDKLRWLAGPGAAPLVLNAGSVLRTDNGVLEILGSDAGVVGARTGTGEYVPLIEGSMVLLDGHARSVQTGFSKVS